MIDTMQTDIKIMLDHNKNVNIKGDNNKNMSDILGKVKSSNDEILSRVVKIETVLHCLLVIPLKKRKSSSDNSTETTLTIDSLFKRVENIESIINNQNLETRKLDPINLILLSLSIVVIIVV